MNLVLKKISKYLKLILKFLKKLFFLSFLILNNISVSSQVNEIRQVYFIWTDNAVQAEKIQNLYLISMGNNTTDTIFPSYWKPQISDTIIFTLEKYQNPVYIEFAFKSINKKSNTFNLIPSFTYNLTEQDDTIHVKNRPLVFDTLNNHARLLYSFLIKLIIELLLAIPVAALLRLPLRIYFFVFVANIMSFPLLYAGFIPMELKELLAVFLEGVFIFLIGWKRLKFSKALLVSLILNVLRYGIAKIVVLIIKIL